MYKYFFFYRLGVSRLVLRAVAVQTLRHTRRVGQDARTRRRESRAIEKLTARASRWWECVSMGDLYRDADIVEVGEGNTKQNSAEKTKKQKKGKRFFMYV